jgi:pimeloyl-ACP methyl ester carboxylesterase
VTAPPLPHVPGVDHQELIVRGLRVHAAFAGPATGHPVVLQHGWPQHWYEWRHLIGPLADAGYRVVVPDFRGFGWSEYPPDEDFRKETLTDDLIALCGELGYPRISLVGHDWGCLVGWLLCIRRPDLVDRAVLLSARSPVPPDRIDPTALGRLTKVAYQLPIAAPLPGAVKRAWFAAMGTALGRGDHGPTDFEPYAATLRQRSQMRASTLLYRQFLTRELGPMIAGRYRGERVTVPVRFLVGDHDLLFYEEMVDEQAGHVDAYEGEVLRGVGHFIPEEAPDLLCDRVLQFLGAPRAQETLETPR